MAATIDKELKTTVVGKCKSFCKHCTLHGVYYLCEASSWIAHVFWCIIITSSLGLCCFLGHMIWEKFVIDPTLTVVETTHYSLINIPFPAVTVCNTESVFPPNTKEITKLLLLRGFNTSEIQDFYKSFTDIKQKGYTLALNIKKMHYMLEDIGYPWSTLLDMLKRPCNDMIVECSWRSRPHNCSEMFRPVYTIAGHCCQFDIPYFMKHADIQTNFMSGVDLTEALEIVVNGQETTIGGDDVYIYASLYVYDYKDKVTLVDSYISLTPESYFDVNVYVWVIDSSAYVKALPLSARKCILETDQGAGAGFYQGCMSRLILRRVVKQCRCLPFGYTSKELDVGDYGICSWERLICIYQTIESVQVETKEIISDNECYQRCDYVQYDTETEFIRNQRYLSKLNQSSSKVLVHFGQTTSMKYRREVLYTWDQMLANLGGIFGLCLGGSVISIIEIIWFFLELLTAGICALCKKSIKHQEIKTNQVYIIPQKNKFAEKCSNKKIIPGKYNFVN